MTNTNNTNIKDLPQLEQILPGNFLVVENFAGTNKLDFSDFVIGPTNTSFYNSLANDIIGLSGNVSTLTSQITSLSSQNFLLDTQLNTNTNSIQQLSSTIRNFGQFIIRREEFVIPQNLATTFIFIEVPSEYDLYNSDINISKLKGNFPNYVLGINDKNDVTVWGISGVPIVNGNNTTYSVLVSTSSITPGVAKSYTYTVIMPINYRQ